MDSLLAILISLGLAAACGFRVFVPLLVLAIAHRAGHVFLSPSLEWIGSTLALVALTAATAIEIIAYKVPWLDHALDTIATPAAVVAGAIIAASQIGTVIPTGAGGHVLMWSAGLIAGGAAAGAVQVGTVATRAASTVTTAGLANPILALAESGAAVVTSVLTVVAPVVGVMVIVIIVLVLVRVLCRIKAAASRAVC